jgi:ribosomal protein L22
MTPEKSTDEQAPEGQEQAKPAAKTKPAAAKKPTAKKPAAKKPAAKKPAAKKPAAKESGAKDGESATTEEKSATKSEAKKPAEKNPAAEKASATKAEKPDAEEPAAEKPAAEKPEKAATAAKRDAQSAASTRARRKVVRAQARYVRTSARKARMVCGHLRGKSVPEARAILAFTPREVARDWSKLLESAVANAENNHELVEDDLLVREAYADEGPTIKRFRPRAQGRATPIRKRTSHLTITLTPKP